MERNGLGFALNGKTRLQLRRLIAHNDIRQKIVKRSTIILMTMCDRGVMAIGASETRGCRWRKYFSKAGVEGPAKSPDKKPISASIKLNFVEKTIKKRPINATHRTVRMMAEELGITHTSVQRIWDERDLRSHRVKIEDIIGLYLGPPETALLPAIDEKNEKESDSSTDPT